MGDRCGVELNGRTCALSHWHGGVHGDQHGPLTEPRPEPVGFSCAKCFPWLCKTEKEHAEMHARWEVEEASAIRSRKP